MRRASQSAAAGDDKGFFFSAQLLAGFRPMQRNQRSCQSARRPRPPARSRAHTLAGWPLAGCSLATGWSLAHLWLISGWPSGAFVVHGVPVLAVHPFLSPNGFVHPRRALAPPPTPATEASQLVVACCSSQPKDCDTVLRPAHRLPPLVDASPTASARGRVFPSTPLRRAQRSAAQRSGGAQQTTVTPSPIISPPLRPDQQPPPFPPLADCPQTGRIFAWPFLSKYAPGTVLQPLRSASREARLGVCAQP